MHDTAVATLHRGALRKVQKNWHALVHLNLANNRGRPSPGHEAHHRRLKRSCKHHAQHGLWHFLKFQKGRADILILGGLVLCWGFRIGFIRGLVFFLDPALRARGSQFFVSNEQVDTSSGESCCVSPSWPWRWSERGHGGYRQTCTVWPAILSDIKKERWVL